jgi:hypothetical protein
MQEAIFTDTFKVSSTKDWQDSGFTINKYKQKGKPTSITINAKDGSKWSINTKYNDQGAKGGMVNMDGIFVGTAKYYTKMFKYTLPYSGSNAQVGQLIYKIGAKGKPTLLGTGVLTLDPNITAYPNNDTIWFMINDDGRSDNEGEVEIIFQVFAEETEEAKAKRLAQEEEEKSRKIEELSKASKEQEDECAPPLKEEEEEEEEEEEQVAAIAKEKEGQIEQIRQQQNAEADTLAQKVVYSQKFVVTSLKGWQDSGFKTNDWIVAQAKDTINIINITTQKNAEWSSNHDGKKGMINMDGILRNPINIPAPKTSSWFPAANSAKGTVQTFISTAGQPIYPYNKQDGKVGQLLFKIGANGAPIVLGTKTLTNNKEELNSVYLNQAQCKPQDTIWFRINDADQQLSDNKGDVEIIFEVVTTRISKG